MNEAILHGDLDGNAKGCPALESRIKYHEQTNTNWSVLFVDCNSKNAKEDGTEAYPYKNINTAIANVPPFATAISIKIKPGVYDYDVNYSRHNLVRIEGVGAVDDVRIKSMYIEAEKVEIGNFTIYGTTDNRAIRTNRGCHIFVFGAKLINEEKATESYGLMVCGASAHVAGCTFDGYEYGIASCFGGSVMTWHNTIKNCVNGMCADQGVMFDRNTTTFESCEHDYRCFGGIIPTLSGVYQNNAQSETVLM